MKVEVTARRLTVDAKTKDTIEKRLEKLAKVLPREAEAKVVVRLEKRGVLVEVTITARQRTWTAEAVAADQLTAAQNALDRVAAQAKKTKARVKEEKKHTTSGVRSPEVAVPAEAPASAREGIRIARRTVAKYREELHIPSSSIRKVESGPAGSPD